MCKMQIHGWNVQICYNPVRIHEWNANMLPINIYQICHVTTLGKINISNISFKTCRKIVICTKWVYIKLTRNYPNSMNMSNPTMKYEAPVPDWRCVVKRVTAISLKPQLIDCKVSDAMCPGY